MEDTINIYWDGYAPMPEVISSLPKAERTEVLTKVKTRREELQYESPTPYIIGMAAILMFFLIITIYPRLKKISSTKNNQSN